MTPRVLMMILMAYSANAWAETAFCQQADATLAKHRMDMYDSGSYSGVFDESKLAAATAALRSSLKQQLQRAQSWQCGYPTAQQNGLHIIQSPDKKVRIFAWDAETGGRMHDFSSMVQLKDARGKTRLHDWDNDRRGSCLPYRIRQDTLPPYGTVYLVQWECVYSTTLRAQMAIWYGISGSRLTPRNLFYYQHAAHSFITYYYASFTAKNMGKRGFFEYGNKTHTLDFPVALQQQNEDGMRIIALTKNRLHYRFNGKYFVYRRYSGLK